MHKLLTTKRARKDLDNLPDTLWPHAQAAITALANNPRPHGCVKIVGENYTYRIRIGDYRAIYDVDDKAQTVLILRVVHRKDAYRDH